MALILTALQFFFITILAFAVIGFQRGWRREAISLAFTLSGVLVLSLGGGEVLGKFAFELFPRILHFLTAGSLGDKPTVTPIEVGITTVVALVAFVAIGYLVSNRAFPNKPSSPDERIWGIIPAIATGFAIVAFITTFFPKANTNAPQLFTVGFEVPEPSNYIIVMFIIAVVAAILGLVAASAKKRSAAKQGGAKGGAAPPK